MTLLFRTPSPRRTFDDSIRPAILLLDIYRLLESQNILTEGELLEQVRELIHGSPDEELLLVYNEIFLGLIREAAELRPSTLKVATLCHLLRQAVVASCSALDTYLPALLRKELPLVIRARRRDFYPRNDNALRDYLAELRFSLDDTLRLMEDPNAYAFIAEKILGLTNFSYLSSRTGVHVTGALLGLGKPWDEIAAHLGRDKRELMSILDETVNRRNDIVHRADRARTDPGGEAQSISYSWTRQAVDTINHICLALDELVAERMQRLEDMVSAEDQGSVPQGE
ncbi:MAG: hypothetical protein GX601_14425 [Anaerolineales bacterium]|nr:hypothetical protein [Anaerolineales bacterium]